MTVVGTALFLLGPRIAPGGRTAVRRHNAAPEPFFRLQSRLVQAHDAVFPWGNSSRVAPRSRRLKRSACGKSHPAWTGRFRCWVTERFPGQVPRRSSWRAAFNRGCGSEVPDRGSLLTLIVASYIKKS